MVNVVYIMMATAFDAAVLDVQNLPNVSNDDKLILYAFFKQATIGDCTQAEPSWISVIARSKWKAWNNLRGMGPEVAKCKYVDTVLRLSVALNQ